MLADSGYKPSKALILASFAAIYLIWGSTYISIIIALKGIPALLMAGSRFLVAGIVLYAISKFRGDANPDWRSVTKISFGGVLMLFCGTGAVAWVEQYIPSGLAAIIVGTVPLWFVLLDKREWKNNLSNGWVIAGLLIGFIGVMTLFADKKVIDFNGDRMKLISVAVLLIGTVAWAIGSLYSKYQPVNGSTSMKAAIQMVAAGVCSLLAGFAGGEQHHFSVAAVSWQSWMALVYLITCGSLIAYMAYVWLLSIRPPTLVGTYAYVNPVVAVFLGWLIANEKISWQQTISLTIILAGVIIVTLFKGKIKKITSS